MLKLEATLIATTAVRPRRGGWSDHGALFIAPDPIRRGPVPVRVKPTRDRALERASFLDEDDIPPAGMAVARRYVSLAAQAAEAAVRVGPGAPLARAWSSLARKIPGA